jgi:hypothetical protein
MGTYGCLLYGLGASCPGRTTAVRVVASVGAGCLGAGWCTTKCQRMSVSHDPRLNQRYLRYIHKYLTGWSDVL